MKASGITFAVTKATDGLGTPDEVFARRLRWKGMRRAGLIRGAYHVARPQKGRDPVDEVREFLATVKAAGGFQDGDLVPVLDIEAYGRAGRLTAKQTLEWARGFVSEMQARVGRRPIIDTGAFWRNEMRNPADDLDCPLWLAAYVDDPERFVPKAWKDAGWTVWQRTNTGSCPGVPGDVDLDVAVSRAALDRLRF